ncbi:MAG: serine--tRNA ligase, partial [candidate division WOR-3 bacterium]|nr:serine--tRNA ligase [candidate division WOR-3 bacterium]
MNLKFIRENPELAKKILNRRKEPVSIDEILTIDSKRRQTVQMRDQLRMQHKQLTEKIAILKKEKKDSPELLQQAKELGQKVKEIENDLAQIELQLTEKLKFLPNVIHESVPDNDTIVFNWGEKPQFSFPPLAHWDLGEALQILDFKAAAKLAGSRFVLFKGLGAQLERALINFCLDIHTKKHNYLEISPPSLNLEECFYNTGALPKQADEMYKCAQDPFYLIPTAEVPLVNLHRDEEFSEDELPKLSLIHI